MKKIFLIFLLGVSFSFAEINEYVSDVYFANGIDTPRKIADESKRKIAKKFKLSHPDSYKYVANWKVSYNHTQGMGIDLYVAMLQKKNRGQE